jgi:hypothetical protein
VAPRPTARGAVTASPSPRPALAMPRACSAPPGKLAAVGDAAEEWADQEVRGFETVLLPRTLDLLGECYNIIRPYGPQ